jgi:DNA polymerase-3 subunit delta'
VPLVTVIGHRRLTALIASAIGRGTLPPALLLAGPSGVGKWRVARATSQAVNCLQPVRRRAERSSQPDAAEPGEPSAPAGGASDACGTCRSCDRIARGVHVDVIALEPDDRASIKIDVVRDALSQAGYRPFEGRRRVVLIREADALEPQSQNALLKSLEEPPASTMFILTTAVPGALLATVRSRCMRLRFGRLTHAEVADVLVRDHGYEPADARSAAALADGSVGHALALGSTNLSILRETALLLLQESAVRGDVAGRLQAAAVVVTGPSKKERPREDIGVILRMAASMLRDVEAINAGADAGVLANPVIAADLTSLASSYAGDRARAAFAAVDRAIGALERNAGTKVVAEWLAVQI